MRTNPGGRVDEAADVADEFLSQGTIYTARHRGQVVDEVKAHGGGAFADAKTVILVNGYTASAAELVTGALQDVVRVLAGALLDLGKVPTFEIGVAHPDRLGSLEGEVDDVVDRADDVPGVPANRIRDPEIGRASGSERG